VTLPSAIVLTVVLAAGCGSQHRRSAEPTLRHGDAAQLIALAQQVARDAPTDGCAAQREIAALQATANDLVAAGRVPLRLRAPLLAGVAAVAADAPACAPPPAPEKTPAPVPKHDNGKHNGEHKGHGHGHDENQDQG
jgi:hypothetical protein